MSMRWFLIFTVCYCAVLPMEVHSEDLDILISPNQFYYEDGDSFGIEVIVSNPGDTVSADFYFALEVYGAYYFFPGWGEDVDYLPITVDAHQSKTVVIIPPVTLPDNLPLIMGMSYAICCSTGTYDLCSTIGMQGIYLNSKWEELPVPDFYNTFYFLPGASILKGYSTQEDFDSFAADLNQHFPRRGPYMQTGLGLIDPVFESDHESQALRTAKKAAAAGLTVAFHIGVTNHHTLGVLDDLRQSDRRYNQWESNGVIFNNEDGDLTAISPSRYAKKVVSARKAIVEEHGKGFLRAIADYPNTVVCLSGPIEVELRRAFNDDPHYADYSPFAIQEFCDWLRHTGEYLDGTGQYSGEGVPRELIGGLDFSQDPSPSEHVGGGMCFNSYFGTNFTTWSLKYWDPGIYPDPLPLTANPMPQPGSAGYLSGGFDAPRLVDGNLTGGNENFNRIWDGYGTTNLINDYQYGYGFRQVLVYHYVLDNSKWLYDVGVPPERSFTHQIPADFLNNWIRHKASASPFWTGFNQYSSPGFTAYWETTQDEIFYQVMDILSSNWGLFEFHPDPDNTSSIDYFINAMELLYKYRCHTVLPLELYGYSNGRYKLIGTVFETACNSSFSNLWPGTAHRRYDNPYYNDEWVDYLPPSVKDVQIISDQMTWSDKMWTNAGNQPWTLWGEFDHFDLFQGDTPDFTPSVLNRIDSTQSYQKTGLNPDKYYKVLAVSKTGLTSPVY